ncbi:hypothetical protein FRB90_008659, partial [Tulasnella sp. 427]
MCDRIVKMDTFLGEGYTAKVVYVKTDDSLLVSSTRHRSQAENVEDCLSKLHTLVLNASAAGITNDPTPEQQQRVKDLQKPPGDETLNVEDRIEVTAFVERKAWILEKIKLLESMPPIEVFYGVDYILPANSGQPVPGLPTRQEVASWMAEHEKIEAETEQFDKGDMIRLKKMAKAKSEQNLSPEDTDLIELTLQTLFALDKLMHLLR